MTQETARDISILAYPSDNKATIESGSADGMIYMRRKFDSIDKKEIPGNEINNILNELRELKLNFSFKAAGIAEPTSMISPVFGLTAREMETGCSLVISKVSISSN